MVHNVIFHWLASGFMQLASGLMQLAATCQRCNILHFTVFLKEKCNLCIRMGITIFNLFILGGIFRDYLTAFWL